MLPGAAPFSVQHQEYYVSKPSPLPSLGLGLGVRPVHYDALLGEHKGSVGWLEALTENYLLPGGRPLHYLERLRAEYPIVLHGVSLSDRKSVV